MSERTVGPVLLDVSERIATVTLNRPEAHNALSGELLQLLPRLLNDAEEDDDIDVIVLTGADPAFCAGLDLGELGSPDGARLIGGADTSRRSRGPFPSLSKPLIGAINGAAVSGGLELALNCDFLVASERAEFGDTHTRLGVMPMWGLSVLLPEAIGVRRAREMSFTGNFLDAAAALAIGLVNHVVAHDELIPFTRRLAADIVGTDRAAVRQLRATYAAIAHDDDAWETEARDSRAWQRTMFDADRIAARRTELIERGRSQ
jgi:enoyl-CoA hydratase/carnithine racemase